MKDETESEENIKLKNSHISPFSTAEHYSSPVSELT
jgi:hypothetical protein